MCGINGALGDDKSAVERMNAATKHRGPDDTGVFSNGLFTIGNNRLAIIDLSPLGHQPMTSPDNRYSIAFNGEIYNFQEIKNELESVGVVFKSHSDTEVILEGYAKWGPIISNKLRGMWALAIIDSKNQTVFLSRDPFGIKPLYLYDDGKTIAFSSEIRGLLAHQKISRTVDSEALREIILMGHAIAPRTILKHVSSVLPGEEISIDLKTQKITRTTPLPEKLSGHIPTDDELEAALQDSVKHHLIADVPVGLFFSGGTDSSLLAALLQSLRVRLKAYHVSIGKRDDTAYAEKIAKTLGLDLHTTILDKETVKNELNAILEKLDEPIADTSLVPTHIVSRDAHKDVKVVLSGEGGDELFGGYIFHKALGSLSLHRDKHMVALGKLLRLFPSLSIIYPRLQGWVRFMASFQKDAVSRYIGERAFGSPLIDSNTFKNAIQTQVSSNEPDGMLALDRLIYLPDNNLLKIDTATMTHSIEGRVPFLDKKIWHLVGGAPLSWKRRGAIGKLPLKRILAKYLPKELVERSKTGFSIPISWYLEALGEERINNAVRWYRENMPHLIPALTAILDWGFDSKREKILSDLGFSIYALVILHEWIAQHQIEI